MEVSGGYIANDGPLQRVDARIKVISLLAVSIGLFTLGTWWALGVYALFIGACVIASGMSPTSLMKGLIPVSMIILVMVIFNSIGVSFGHEDIGRHLVGPFFFKLDGFLQSLFFAGRIVLLVSASLVLTSATSITELTDALSWTLSPLRRLHVPVDDIAMMVTIALRFIPLVYAEIVGVKDAQIARGASFSQGSVFKRIGAWAPVLIPVFVKIFKRSDSLARAMDARGYGIGPRTRVGIRPLHMTEVSGIGLLIILVITLGVLG